MLTVETRTSCLRIIVLPLVVAIGASHMSTVAAQQPYYYEPGPDYYHNDTASGTVLGGGLGALTGALVGGKKNGAGGALIGAGVGALTGNILGRNKDREDQRRAAAGAAAVGRLNQQAAAQAVTGFDLVEMTQAGLSDDLIVSTIRARGARLDLSPAGLIALKQSGVSDRVVLAAQEMSGNRSLVTRGAPTLVTEAPRSTVIVTPASPYYYGPRYHHHFYHRRPRHRSHFHYSVGF